MYKEIKNKIRFDDILSVHEYNFLTTVLTGKYALTSNTNTIRVERTFIERYSCITKEHLIVDLCCLNMLGAIHSIGCVYHGIETFAESLMFLGFKQFPFFIGLLGIMYGMQNTSPIEKSYKPKKIDNFNQ